MRGKGSRFIVIGLILITLGVVWTIYNLIVDNTSGQRADQVLEQYEDGDPSGLIDPNREMPTILIDGVRYIGRIEVPGVGIDLPVAAKWSYSILSIAPGRYTGSIYKDDMVIAGHNYRNHFGPLARLHVGENVYFTDVEHNKFEYVVGDIEVIDPYDVETMTKSEYDLTLFTCTLGGRTRLTVRCDRVSDNFIK